jgi:protein-S-isoprenylcysteine O-methyltransferase Ste14
MPWLPDGFALAFVCLTAAHAIRMRREEANLEAKFGAAYREYARRTKRLIPGLY